MHTIKFDLLFTASRWAGPEQWCAIMVKAFSNLHLKNADFPGYAIHQKSTILISTTQIFKKYLSNQPVETAAWGAFHSHRPISSSSQLPSSWRRPPSCPPPHCTHWPTPGPEGSCQCPGGHGREHLWPDEFWTFERVLDTWGETAPSRGGTLCAPLGLPPVEWRKLLLQRLEIKLLESV